MKRIAILLLIAFTTILIPTIGNADVITVEAKAEALNKLTILKGDGVNFNLTGQLKRSEAITFVVRIMGQEANVITDASKYNVTTFTDVKPTDWFAPYVGFAKEQKILDGFPDGGFHPEESISEKAFLKLVLGALGYINDKDFVWATIYPSALNLGLVSDPIYKTQDSDNLKYLRSSVVDVLYSSLKINNRDLRKSIIQTLIDKNIVSQAIAAQLGLVKEIIPTTIDKVEVVNQNNLTITLNKTVNTLLDTNIQIYETGNKANLLAATVTSQVYSNITLTTATQIPDKNYTIEITSTDESNNASKVSSVFKGPLIKEIQSAYFKISKVTAVSKNVINVYFTQPILSIGEIGFPAYYEIYKNNVLYVKGNKNNMIVKVLSGENNAVSIYLKEGQISDVAPYSVKVSGDIVSAYGAQLNDGNGDSADFTSQVAENSELNVTKISPIDLKTLSIEFNQEIDASTAKLLANYEIKNSNGDIVPIVKLTLLSASKGKTVLLTIQNTFDPATNYQIIIKGINDLFNIKSIQDTNVSISGKTSTDLRVLKITRIIAVDKSTLQVNFDKKLDPNSAVNTPYYILTGVTDPNFITIPIKVYVNPTDSSNITLYLPAGKEFTASSIYKLKVLNVIPDELGNISTIDTISPVFTGSANQINKPTITEATIIGKDTIKVKSSKELLDYGNNLTLSNYSLELKDGKNTFILKTPSSIAMYDATTLILHFDNIDLTKSYTFKFTSLTDITGLNVRTVTDGNNFIILKNGNTP